MLYEPPLLTLGKIGHIRTWTRPREGVTNESRADLSSTMSATGSGVAADPVGIIVSGNLKAPQTSFLIKQTEGSTDICKG